MNKYTGGCHCGAVRYEVETEIEKLLECNCSHCHKKGFLLHAADKETFKLLSGADYMQEYFFNKKTIRHSFCKTCGVQSYAEGITFPKMMINVRCLDNVDIRDFEVMHYNGKDI